MGKTGHRIWYGLAIFLSALVLLLSVAGIAGVWITERILADTAVQVLEAVGNVTGSLRQAIQGVDQKLERMQSVSFFISIASARISDEVTDQGLIKLLLPEEQDQRLVTLSSSVKETVNTVSDTLSAGLSMYQTIDRLPFVSLPAPSQEQVDNISSTVDDIQSAVDDVQTSIVAFRSGASDQISKVETGADLLTTRLGQSRDRLAEVNARLAIVQEKLIQLQKTVGTVFALAAFLFTLLLAWIIYSQVEVLRLYVQRWKTYGKNTRIIESAELPIGGGSDTLPPTGISSSVNSDTEGTTG
jgi:methyl-accepting chemotaxis protein